MRRKAIHLSGCAIVTGERLAWAMISAPNDVSAR